MELLRGNLCQKRAGIGTSEGGRCARASPVVPLTAGVSERDATETKRTKLGELNG
jgi:hypothetical protein